MEMNFFDHDHPLILSDEIDGCSVPCNICSHPIMGLTYSCRQCTFAVHKWCGELPKKITIQHFDEKHSLALQKTSPTASTSSSSFHFTCDMCHHDGLGYAFRCSDLGCAFTTHVECGWSRSMREIGFMYYIKGERCRFDYYWPGTELDHPYTCIACGNRGSGPRLECDDYNSIVIHIQCARLPETAKHVTHVHALMLSTITDVIENKEEEFICDACEEARNPKCWVYHCPEAECGIRVHINCAIVPPAVQDNWSRRLVRFVRNNPLYKDASLNNPRRRRRIEMQRRAHEWETNLEKIHMEFAEASEREDKRKEVRLREAKDEMDDFIHFDHKHPLKPYDEPFKQHGAPCPICTTAIYGKTFGCEGCDYFLHKWCAKLQRRIQHPLHEHPLSLEPSDANQWNCGLCDSFRGLCMCYTCNRCNFNLEVLCAALPKNLNHKLDEHTLTPLRTTLDERLFGYFSEKFAKRLGDLPRCNACGFPCEDVSLECEKCNIHLHIHCFLLPAAGKHPSHIHELVLSLPPERIYPSAVLDEFICDACEKNRDPEDWVYLCPECDGLFVAHVNCAASPKLVATSMAFDELQTKIEDFRLEEIDAESSERDILIEIDAESSERDILIESSDEDILIEST